MPLVTISIGVVLTIISGTFYFLSVNRSPTALIPAIIGIVFVLLGALATKPNLRKHVMHAACVWALVAMLGSASGIVKGIQYLGGSLVNTPETPVRPLAYLAMSLTFGLCLLFLVLAVRSFIAARKARTLAV